MTAWTYIVLLAIIGGAIAIGFNIRSLIMKWKHNPHKWFDLLVGIVISVAAIVGLVFIFISQIPK